jgi:hypothetical protein
MSMKAFTLLAFVLIFISLTSAAQSQDKIINFFKVKNVDSVITYCVFPFDLSAGTMVDQNAIKDPAILKSKLQQLFKQNYFSGFFKGKKTVNDKNAVIYEVHSYNKEGEMESESSLMFNFKKNKEGKLRLYQIVMAG